MITKTRETKETKVTVTLNLYGTGKADCETGIGFFDHMLTALAVHSGIDLELRAKGDLPVDCHHTIEDVGIVLGEAWKEALGEKKGIARYGNAYVPMDEALCFAAVDCSGRPFLVFDHVPTAPMIGTYDSQMTVEFFRAFAMNGGITLHLRSIYGANEHHMVEGLFKAAARALKEAIAKTGSDQVLSSKGVLS